MRVLVALLLAAFLLVPLIPAYAARGNSFSADLTLLDLGADLHGAYVSSEDWMLLAGNLTLENVEVGGAEEGEEDSDSDSDGESGGGEGAEGW